MRNEFKIITNWCSGLAFATLSFYIGHCPEDFTRSQYNAASQFLGVILTGLLALNCESRYLKLFWGIMAAMINLELAQDVFYENYKPTHEDYINPFFAVIILSYVIAKWKASKNK